MSMPRAPVEPSGTLELARVRSSRSQRHLDRRCATHEMGPASLAEAGPALCWCATAFPWGGPGYCRKSTILGYTKK